MLLNFIVNVIRYLLEKLCIYIISFFDINSYFNIDIVSFGTKINEFEKFFCRFWWGDNLCYFVGQGLGFFLVKVIVELYGGSVMYYYFNKYNVFWIMLL